MGGTDGFSSRVVWFGKSGRDRVAGDLWGVQAFHGRTLSGPPLTLVWMQDTGGLGFVNACSW